MQETTDEVRSVKTCINNLIGIVALPSIWAGRETAEIVTVLVDTLINVLQLDSLYVAVNGGGTTSPLEMIRSIDAHDPGDLDAILKEALKQALTCETWPFTMRRSSRRGTVSIAAYRLGVTNEIGALVGASYRSDFPDANERLLLNVAANQAAIGLQEARIVSQQKQISKELDQRVAQQTEELNRFFSVSLDLLCVADQRGYFLRVNEAWKKTLGYDLSELLARPFIDFVHPDDVSKTQTAFDGLVAKEKVVNFVNRFQCRDGSYRWLEWSASAGDQFVFGSARDITARRQADERLREHEQQLRLIIDTIPILAQQIRPDGFVEYQNKRWVEYTGLPLEKGLGWGWNATIHPDDLPQMLEIWRGLIARGTAGEAEARMRRFDGQYRWFLFRAEPAYDSFGNVIRWYTTNADIQDLKTIEAELRTSEGRWRRIIENSAVGIALTDLGGHFEITNVSFQQLLRYSEEELQELSYLEVTVPEFHPQNRMLVDDLLAGKRQQFNIEKQYLRKDGGHVWVRNNVSLVPGPDGEPRYLLAIVENISDRKSAEEVLRQAQARLARATQVATAAELTAAIAHEINQPLAAVVSNAHAGLRWLSADSPNVHRAGEALERIVHDGNDAAEVVRRTRALFTGAKPLKTLLSVGQLVGEVLRLVEGEAAKKHVSIRTNLPQNLPTVLGDRLQIQQVLLNLVVNGIEATDQVTDREKMVSILAAAQSPEVRVEITDNGIGLRDPDKVFEAFFTTKEGGIGMGLAICRTIIESHDGKLWASSSGGGTTFGFTLPIESSAAKSAGAFGLTAMPTVRRKE